MKSFLFIMVLYGEVSFASSISLETEQVIGENMQFSEKGLDSYSLQQEPIPILRTQASNIMVDQTQQIPEFSGGNMTGYLDIKGRRRCGVPDLDENFFLKKVSKWAKKDLTYKIMNYTRKMTRADVDDAIKRAFKMWSDVTPLTFAESKSNSADILIYFGAGIHSGDQSDCPFDGEGEVLAHAFLPYDTTDISGDAHFDEDEKWTTKKTEKETNLFLVATHEFGHSLGLDHTETKGAVMSSIYDPGSYEYAIPSDPRTLRLHRNDIENIQSLYGCPKHGLCLARKSPAEQKSLLSICNRIPRFDAVTTFQGKLFFFLNRNFIQKDHRKTKIKPISDLWPILKCGIDAAYEAEGTLYLFKGKKYRTVSGMDKQPSDPNTIDTLGLFVPKIDAAAYDKRTKKTLFFSENWYWRYDQKKMSVDSGYPRKIAADFPRIGSEVDAAFQHNGRLYLFRNKTQFEFDKQHNLRSTKRIGNWFDCP